MEFKNKGETLFFILYHQRRRIKYHSLFQAWLTKESSALRGSRQMDFIVNSLARSKP